MKNKFASSEFLTTVKKVAVFRALYLGDMLCIIPAVRAIRKALPNAKIILIGLSWQKEFVNRFSQYFDDFIDFPGWPGLPEQEINADKIVRFLTIARHEQFDLIFQMQGNGLITNDLCSQLGARMVCGLRSKTDTRYPSQLFPVAEDDEHEVLRFLKLPKALGMAIDEADLEFPLQAEEEVNFLQLKSKFGFSGDYICIHPGARDVRRRWSADNFAYVANELVSRGYTNLVLTGSLAEQELLEAVQHKINSPVLNIVEKFGNVPLGELACIIKNAKFLVSNDTGVSHIAAALRVPSVVIFSDYSKIERWAPLNRGLHFVVGPKEASDPEYVLYHILDHLGKQKSNRSVLLDQK